MNIDIFCTNTKYLHFIIKYIFYIKPYSSPLTQNPDSTPQD